MEVVGYQQDANCLWMAVSTLGLEQVHKLSELGSIPNPMNPRAAIS